MISMGWNKNGKYIDFKENIPCPVCGKYIFEVEVDYDICPYCKWENDREQECDPDEVFGANKISINDARKAWKQGKTVLEVEQEM